MTSHTIPRIDAAALLAADAAAKATVPGSGEVINARKHLEARFAQTYVHLNAGLGDR